jgi:hypothetical protein
MWADPVFWIKDPESGPDKPAWLLLRYSPLYRNPLCFGKRREKKLEINRLHIIRRVKKERS